jgi:hypothetical protein
MSHARFGERAEHLHGGEREASITSAALNS